MNSYLFLKFAFLFSRNADNPSLASSVENNSENELEDKINNSIVIIESEELFDKIRSLSKKE